MDMELTDMSGEGMHMPPELEGKFSDEEKASMVEQFAQVDLNGNGVSDVEWSGVEWSGTE